MKKICLLRTPISDTSLNIICNIMQNKCELIIRNGNDYKRMGHLSPFTDEELKTATAIIGNPSLETLKKCENLQWLQLASSGADAYANCEYIDRNKTILTNATGAYGHAIAEYMVAGVLSLTKKFHLYRDNQNNRQWLDMGMVKTIRNSKVLVVGLGDIGGQFAEKMNALGAEIYAIKRTLSDVPEYVKSLSALDKLDELLPEMDVIALCLPNSAQTQNIISCDQFRLMKNEAVLINVGRGNAVDTDALVYALHNGLISGAVLDVTNPEPLPADHPLWKEKNVIITPHVSGGYHAQETIEGIEAIMIENARRYVNDEPLMNQVDYNTGYKKK